MSLSADPPVRVEIHGAVQLVTIDRPARRNAVDHATLLGLIDAQAQARDSEGGIRAVVLTGAAPAFSAGADLTGVESGEFTRLLASVLQGFGRLPITVIAAVDGPALGAGTQLAIACDVRVATPESRFGIPAAQLGLAVDEWTIERLSATAGASIARNMLLTAATYTAEQLEPNGFIHRRGDLDIAMEWAARIARLAPLTIAAHKLALEALLPPHPHDPLFEQARLAAWASDDATEGRQAFLEKRSARFTGA
jgi:enoyl-CoA hydratase